MRIKTCFMTSLVVLALVVLNGCTPNKGQLKNVNDRDNRYVNSDEGAYQEEKSTFKTNSGPDDVKNSRVSSSGKDDSRDYPVAEYSVREEGDDASADYYQTGIASWYGREFHGKMTASGERFDMNEMTAAHKTLPFGTLLEVKNLDNGKSVKVRINDRGPYRGKRILDLSHAAAKKLDMVSSGEAMVGISVLGKDKGVQGASAEKKAIVPVASSVEPADKYNDAEMTLLQVGAFYSRKNAERLKEKVEGMTSSDVHIVDDGSMYKVRVKARSKSDADNIRHTLQKDNIGTYVVNEVR